MPSILALRRPIAAARRRVRDWWRGESDRTYFDLHDLRAVNAAIGPHAPPLSPDPVQADDGVAGAARVVLGQLAAYDCGSPDALTAGINSHHAKYLLTALSPTRAANVRAAFAANLGERGKRVYEFREDLREVFPFGMTPHPDRGRLLTWLVTNGVSDLGLTVEEALWFLFERDEEPDRGLAATYLVRADWQAKFPRALTPGGWAEFKQFLASEYGLAGRWFREATLPKPWWAPLPNDSAAGVNVLAHFRYPSGLQEAALGVVEALDKVGVPTARRDLPVLMPPDGRDRTPYQDAEVFDTTVYVAAVNTLPRLWYPRAGLHARPGVRRIAVWYWELEELPAEWVPDLGWPDEVWAPSRFVADAVRKAVRVPVVPMLPGVKLPPFAPRPRSYFKLPEDRFLFLFAFDMNSVMERKNPLGLIAAFKRAFRADDRAHLVVKVTRGSSDPLSLAKLRAAADDRVTVMDEVFTRADTRALFAACDGFASLHRSEGLGLGMAEAMLIGKPVVATGYSGNLDFMTPDTGYLVEHGVVPVGEGHFPYPATAHWAEPSVEHAAELLRRVYEHRDEAKDVADRGRTHVAELLSIETAGRRMAARLAELRGVR